MQEVVKFVYLVVTGTKVKFLRRVKDDRRYNEESESIAFILDYSRSCGI